MSTIEIFDIPTFEFRKRMKLILAVVFKASRYDFTRYLMMQENITLDIFLESIKRIYFPFEMQAFYISQG